MGLSKLKKICKEMIKSSREKKLKTYLNPNCSKRGKTFARKVIVRMKFLSLVMVRLISMLTVNTLHYPKVNLSEKVLSNQKMSKEYEMLL